MTRSVLLSIALAPIACGGALATPSTPVTVELRPPPPGPAPANVDEAQLGMLGVAPTDDEPAKRNMWGDSVAEAFGVGGLGLAGGGAPKSRGPNVRPGDTSSVNGRLPPEVIQRVIRQNFVRFRACYERGLQVDPKLAGKVTVRFEIAPDGSVSAVSKGESTLPNKDVVACVTSAFMTISFPQPDGGKVSVIYPLVFTPSD
jgi:hypothetical protein